MLEVIAGVDDHRQLVVQRLGQSKSQLGAADATGQGENRCGQVRMMNDE